MFTLYLILMGIFAVVLLLIWLSPDEGGQDIWKKDAQRTAFEEDRAAWERGGQERGAFIRDYLLPRYCPRVKDMALTEDEMLIAVLGGQFRRFGIDTSRIEGGCGVARADLLVRLQDVRDTVSRANEGFEIEMLLWDFLESTVAYDLVHCRIQPGLENGLVTFEIVRGEHRFDEFERTSGTAQSPAAPAEQTEKSDFDHGAAAAGTVLFGPMGAALGEIAARNRERDGRK